MAENKIFVGRRDELDRFKEVLEEPQGQAVVVVGQAGMGKTWLVNKMTALAEKHPDLKCGWVRYEVTPTDTVDSTMALMMDNAFAAASAKPGSFDKVPERKRQWVALLKLAKLIPAGKILGKAAGEKAERIIELWKSLQRDPAKNTREQFLERLELISKRMPENGRAIFVIDPEKYMQKQSDQSWAIVAKQLPEKIKFVFAQRPEDELIKGNMFKGLGNVVYIPERKLDVLDKSSVEELVRLRAGDVEQSEGVLQEAVKQYKGHPYAIQAALDIVGKTKNVEGLPQDPTPEAIAETQWGQICDNGDDAVKLFEAYAVLEVGVPGEVVEAVSGLGATTRKRLQRDKYLGGLLRDEGEGKRIYHAILADYILGQIGEGQKKEYHKRAAEVYREKLRRAKEEQVRPEEMAAMRLAEHVLAAEGEKAFVDAFVEECYGPLFNLGLLDVAISLSERALGFAKRGSEKEAMVRGNLGLIYQTRGELERAEEMFRKGLKIDEKLGRLEGIAAKYGNLGLIYRRRGELERAEEMHLKSLEIAEKFGRLEGMANQYGNLGLICQMRGELERAEEMHLKSLEIDKKLGHLEGMANDYGNLGVIYQTWGELDKAEEMYHKVLEIEEKLGRPESIANAYGNLGGVYQRRGELERAEEMHLKALEIDKKLGLLEGMANEYGNLGLIYEARGDVGKAREYWEKAVGIYEKIGMPHMVEEVKGWLK